MQEMQEEVGNKQNIRYSKRVHMPELRYRQRRLESDKGGV